MVHLPTLKQLKYLLALSKANHFGNAAKACYVSQSTLSAGIRELEESLGVSLVERNSKQVLFTPIGEDIVARSHKILNGVEDLVSLCEVSSEPFTSKMRLGVIPTIAPFLLPKLLNKLRQKHPAFQLYIREHLSEQLVDELNNGELDVLFLALPYAAEGVGVQHLFYDDFLLAIPDGHPLVDKKNLKTLDLKGQDLLLLEDGHCLRDHALEACHLKNSDFSSPYQATSLNTIVQMIANDIGITLLPQMALDAKILTGTTVKVKRFNEKNVWRSIGLMWRKKCPREMEFQLLGDFIKNVAV